MLRKRILLIALIIVACIAVVVVVFFRWNSYQKKMSTEQIGEFVSVGETSETNEVENIVDEDNAEAGVSHVEEEVVGDDLVIVDTDNEQDMAEQNLIAGLDESSVLEMLGTFDRYTAYMLFSYYYGVADDWNEAMNYRVITPGEAYALAGLALRDSYLVEVESSAYDYAVLPTDLYQQYLDNMFGSEYTLDQFEYYMSPWGTVVDKSDSGHYDLLLSADYGQLGSNVAIEYISDMPDENGVVSAVARYDVFTEDEGSDDQYYMRFLLRPDETSDYGCVIVGMIPAGHGAIESEFLPDADAESEMPDWGSLYADYIQANLTDSYFGEETAYYAVCLNSDYVPEIMCETTPETGRICLLYIRDGQVNMNEMEDLLMGVGPGFGTIETCGYEGDFGYNRVYYLNDNNEFSLMFDGRYEMNEDEFFNYTVDGESVSGYDYTTMQMKAASIKHYGFTKDHFASDAKEAISALNSGNVDVIYSV